MSEKRLVKTDYRKNCIEVYGSYSLQPFTDEDAVYLQTIVNSDHFRSDFVTKPLFANAKNKKWKRKVEKAYKKMVQEAKDLIDKEYKKKEITDGLLDSLNDL